METVDGVVDCRIPSEWRELSDDAEEVLDAMAGLGGVSWYDDFPYNIHRITSNQQISSKLKGYVDEYRRRRREGFRQSMQQKDQDYTLENDRGLAEVREYLGTEQIELRRVEVDDVYEDGEIPEDRIPLPRDECDIIAVLEEGLDTDALYNAGEMLGLEPSRVGEELEGMQEHVAMVIPDTDNDPGARAGMSVSRFPGEELYLLGGANYQRPGVEHREPGNAFQPFHNGEPSWNLKLLDEYLERV